MTATQTLGHCVLESVPVWPVPLLCAVRVGATPPPVVVDHLWAWLPFFQMAVHVEGGRGSGTMPTLLACSFHWDTGADHSHVSCVCAPFSWFPTWVFLRTSCPELPAKSPLQRAGEQGAGLCPRNRRGWPGGGGIQRQRLVPRSGMLSKTGRFFPVSHSPPPGSEGAVIW
jgi:hypothetical protein